METKDFNIAPGHWILARMGKKVLRPGGKELTEKLIAALQISPEDDIAEFAPGLGFTAGLALVKKPKSYVGIDADENAVKHLKKQIKGSNISFILGNAAETTIGNQTKDKVFGEAMLTMHADHRKSEIVKEAYRILREGGMYGIHELGLIHTDEQLKKKIQRNLAQSIKVNARPLEQDEWINLLEKEGFKVTLIKTNTMSLLEPKRIIDDEGFFRSLKIGFNILTHPKARKRILEMRKVFKKYQTNINAVVIIAEKK